MTRTHKEYIYYCPKCGNACFRRYDDTEDKCSICGHTTIESPHEYELSWEEYDAYTDGRKGGTREEFERVWGGRMQRLHDEVVSKSPIFDPDLYNRRDEIRDEKFRKFQEMLHGVSKENPYGVKCPYCKSTEVKQISGFAKAGLFTLFGIFAMGKNSKQWHCKNCGSDF